MAKRENIKDEKRKEKGRKQNNGAKTENIKDEKRKDKGRKQHNQAKKKV